MFGEGFFIVAGFIGAVTLLFCAGIALSEPKKFVPAAVAPKIGVYQNKFTGSVVEVRHVEGNNMAYLVDNGGGWLVSYDLINERYEFIGDL